VSFAYLGDIILGEATMGVAASWTGPVGAGNTRHAALAEHKVSRGKPILQDHGDDLDTRTLEFLFDETFCAPAVELGKLDRAYAAREAMPYVGGDGAFDGKRWVIEGLDAKFLRATPTGRIVRMQVTLQLKEASGSTLGFMGRVARAAASALSSIASGNVGVRR
jgi:phage protein U